MGASASKPEPPPLPPYPPEVMAHCRKHGCQLKGSTIDLPSPAAANKRGSNSRSDQQTKRDYVVHTPSASSEQLALVVCLHGTDETIHDTELLAQCDDKTAWLDLSHQENFVVVFPQSLRYSAKGDVPMSWRPLGDNLRSCWQPDNNDELFISLLLERLYIDHPTIDQTRVYCVGFSNGGLFLTSLLLSHGFNKKYIPFSFIMSLLNPCNYDKTDKCLISLFNIF